MINLIIISLFTTYHDNYLILEMRSIRYNFLPFQEYSVFYNLRTVNPLLCNLAEVLIHAACLHTSLI